MTFRAESIGVNSNAAFNSPIQENKPALFFLIHSFNEAVNGGEQSGCLSVAKKILNIAFPIIVAVNLLLLPFIMAYNCFFASSGIEPPVKATSPLDGQDAIVADVEVKDPPQIESDMHVVIPPEVKKTLDQLFEGSPYAIDTLPIYPIVLNMNNHPAAKREKMTAPVMKGTCDDGRPFIAIKVDCTLRNENIEKAGLHKALEHAYKNNPQLEKVLCLYQNFSFCSNFIWSQIGSGSMFPEFFTWNFTYQDGSGPTESQKDNFKRVQTLLKTGQSEDNRGLVWHISTT
jgi:hypothetical protein